MRAADYCCKLKTVLAFHQERATRSYSQGWCLLIINSLLLSVPGGPGWSPRTRTARQRMDAGRPSSPARAPATSLVHPSFKARSSICGLPLRRESVCHNDSCASSPKDLSSSAKPWDSESARGTASLQYRQARYPSTPPRCPATRAKLGARWLRTRPSSVSRASLRALLSPPKMSWIWRARQTASTSPPSRDSTQTKSSILHKSAGINTDLPLSGSASLWLT